jgi:hypothetical protein
VSFKIKRFNANTITPPNILASSSIDSSGSETQPTPSFSCLGKSNEQQTYSTDFKLIGSRGGIAMRDLPTVSV